MRPILPVPKMPAVLPCRSKPSRPVEREVEFPDPIEGAVKLSVQCEDQRDRVLGHRVGRVVRHARHRQPQFLRGRQVHLIEARATQGQQTHS